MLPDKGVAGTGPAGDGREDVIEVLVRDHREVERMFDELDSGTGDATHRRRLADAVTAELVRHSVAEEEYLYPAARRSLPDGDALADREIREHAEAEELLKRLEGVSATDEHFDQVLRRVMSAVRAHIREEESDLFPRLRERCGAAELRELGRKVAAAKSIAPTRPHPSAPHTPPMNKLTAPGVGLVDRVRDALRHRATSMEDAR